MKTVFVTGTDTGVGKTFVSCALVRGLRHLQQRVIVLKPVAAGCAWQNGQWQNDDALALQQAGGNVQSYASINPFALPLAMAPHLAAQAAKLRLSLNAIEEHIRREQQREGDICVIEGAGGFLVPLNDEHTFADIALRLKTPVILVVAMRLGCINHALLSAEAIRARGITLLGWVANQAQAEKMPRHDDNLTYLCRALNAPLLADLPWQGGSPQSDTALAAAVLATLANPLTDTSA